MANNRKPKEKKNKHAPSEASTKEAVSKVRQIPGLDTSKYKESKFGDIRFDPTFGKANDSEVRKNYRFLDEYRTDEIQNLTKMVNDPKSKAILSPKELEDLEYRLKSLKSRMDSLRNKDFAAKIKRGVRNQYWDDIKQGKKGHYMKRSDQKRLTQVEKFKELNKSKIEKVIERKRKKRLAKEYKSVEFLKNNRN